MYYKQSAVQDIELLSWSDRYTIKGKPDDFMKKRSRQDLVFSKTSGYDPALFIIFTFKGQSCLSSLVMSYAGSWHPGANELSIIESPMPPGT